MVVKKFKTKLGKSKRTKKRIQRGGGKDRRANALSKNFRRAQQERRKAELSVRTPPAVPKRRTPKQSFGSNPLNKFFGFNRRPKPGTPLSHDTQKNGILSRLFKQNPNVPKLSTQQLYAVVHPTSTSKRPFEPYEIPVVKRQIEEGIYADLKQKPNEYEEPVPIKNMYEEPVPLKNQGTDYGYLNVNPETSKFKPQNNFSKRVAHLPPSARITNDTYESTI
jgi:hypothetical protein